MEDAILRLVRNVAGPVLLWVCLAALAGPSAAQAPDDPFYDWDLESYRLTRTPDQPTGGILPLPDPPTDLVSPALLTSSLRCTAADVPGPLSPGPDTYEPSWGGLSYYHRVHYADAYQARRGVEEEADGIMLPNGVDGRAELDGVVPLPLHFRAQLAGRFVAGVGSHSGGSWLERNLVRSGERFELRIGATRSFWGDGSEGSLLLGRTTPPLDMIRVRTVRPLHLPYLESAGRIQGSVFVAYLNDGARTIADPLLHGSRLEWEPTGWMRLAASRTIVFGGAGRTQDYRLRDLVNMFIGRGQNIPAENKVINPADSKASFTLELRLPEPYRTSLGLDGARAFYEYAGDDAIKRFLPTAPAHNLGFVVGHAGWIALAEYSMTVNNPDLWYWHVAYGADDYYYRGYSMGHPMGGDGRSRHVRIWTPAWGGNRAQVWWRMRGHGHQTWWYETPNVPADVGGEVLRETSLGCKVRHDLGGGLMIETSFEGFAEGGRFRPRPPPPVRWDGTVALRLGSPRS